MESVSRDVYFDPYNFDVPPAIGESPMTKPDAVYVRVSSRTQSLRSQEADLERWIEAQSIDARWYRDKATGTKMERPAMDRLLADVAAGKVRKIIVWRLDRLGRTCSGLTKLFDDLRAIGCGLYSLRDSLDLDTPAGRLMANVLASIAAYETEVRRERQTIGIAAAQAAGKRWGGSKPGRRRITSEQHELILRMRSEGATIAAIHRATQVSRPTIYSVLNSANGHVSQTER
jgi:DNA invertase Pin-like site-specific DNA recombinase